MILRSIIEVVGFPKDHVEETTKKIIDNIEKEEKDIRLINAQIADAKESKGMFSTFAEIEVDVKDFEALIHFCFFYMPASVEIIEPDKFNIPQTELTNLLNDLLAKLHQNDIIVQKLLIENRVLKSKSKSSSQK